MFNSISYFRSISLPKCNNIDFFVFFAVFFGCICCSYCWLLAKAMCRGKILELWGSVEVSFVCHVVMFRNLYILDSICGLYFCISSVV